MDRRYGVESFSKTLWKARQHLRIKGRPHQQVDHHQIQDQDDSLANTMCHETLVPSQERAKGQSNTHRDLNRKIQICAIASMSAEKTFHSAHFLTCAEPLSRKRHPTALLDFSLLLFSQEIPALVAGELFSADVIVRHAGHVQNLAHAGNHSMGSCYVKMGS
jgi:hypothetical protein